MFVFIDLAEIAADADVPDEYAACSDPRWGELIALSIPEVDQAARVITGLLQDVKSTEDLIHTSAPRVSAGTI